MSNSISSYSSIFSTPPSPSSQSVHSTSYSVRSYDLSSSDTSDAKHISTIDLTSILYLFNSGLVLDQISSLRGISYFELDEKLSHHVNALIERSTPRSKSSLDDVKHLFNTKQAQYSYFLGETRRVLFPENSSSSPNSNPIDPPTSALNLFLQSLGRQERIADNKLSSLTRIFSNIFNDPTVNFSGTPLPEGKLTELKALTSRFSSLVSLTEHAYRDSDEVDSSCIDKLGEGMTFSDANIRHFEVQQFAVDSAGEKFRGTVQKPDSPLRRVSKVLFSTPKVHNHEEESIRTVCRSFKNLRLKNLILKRIVAELSLNFLIDIFNGQVSSLEAKQNAKIDDKNQEARLNLNDYLKNIRDHLQSAIEKRFKVLDSNSQLSFADIIASQAGPQGHEKDSELLGYLKKYSELDKAITDFMRAVSQNPEVSFDLNQQLKKHFGSLKTANKLVKGGLHNLIDWVIHIVRFVTFGHFGRSTTQEKIDQTLSAHSTDALQDATTGYRSALAVRQSAGASAGAGSGAGAGAGELTRA